MKINNTVALAFVLIVTLGTIVIVAIANQQPPTERMVWLYTLSWTQLILASATYWRMGGNENNRENILFQSNTPSRRVVSVVLVSSWALAMAIVFALTERADHFLPGNMAVITWQLIYFIVLIALPEELVYRGLTFAALGRRSATAVFISAGLFSLMHFNNGIHTLPYFFAFGLLFGTLRRYGATLVQLVLWHGLFDFVNEAVWPEVGFRFSATAFYVIAPLAFLSITSIAGWALTATGQRDRGL
jgi:membrane protease YdiL (CAAX protease family)